MKINSILASGGVFNLNHFQMAISLKTFQVTSLNPCWDQKGKYTLDGIHTHPDMCDAYFYCNNGTHSVDHFCPEGLLFNGQTCDFPHSVQCETKCEYGE